MSLESKKIRVVHIVPTLRDGGAEALLRNLLPLLALQPDLDVHVISIYSARLDESERTALGAPLHEIGRRGRADLSFAPRLVTTLRRLQPHITHGHIHAGKFAGRLASIAAGVGQIVFTEHGDEARGAVHWTVNRLLNAHTARFVVFTNEERAMYATRNQLPLSRVKVIANGIPVPPAVDTDAVRAELGLSGNDFALVVAARLVHQKNQQLAIQAVAKLATAGRRNVRLFIIGQGPDEPLLKNLASELQVSDVVHFLGYRRDAQRLTAACDVLALPSRWERMPLVMGEAMFARVPVVSAPWTGVRSFIEDGKSGYLADDWSTESFCSALLRAIDDPVARRKIGERSCQVASERFDISLAVKEHVDLYRELAPCTARQQSVHHKHLTGPGISSS